jgi:hypothetical protein
VEGDWLLYEEHILRDTFVYWLKDSLIYKKDSLSLLVSYAVTDSLMNYVPRTDTLGFHYREAPQQAQRGRRRDQEEVPEKKETLSLSVNGNSKEDQDLHRDLVIEAGHPVQAIDTSRIVLQRKEDTLEFRVPYSLIKDEVKLRRYFQKVDWQGVTGYKLSIFPGAFTDIYGLTNDTLIREFRTRDPEYYGRILLNLTGVNGNKIIQVLDSKSGIVAEKYADSDGLIEIDHMEPASYTLKLVHDRNGNGRWDTGDYLDRLQPEKVEFHPGEASIRSNFDVEINWNLGAEDPG